MCDFRESYSRMSNGELLPRESLNWPGRVAFDRLASRVAAAGEPFRLFLDPANLAAQLKEMGFQFTEDLGRGEINARYFSDRTDKLPVGGRLGRLMSAVV